MSVSSSQTTLLVCAGIAVGLWGLACGEREPAAEAPAAEAPAGDPAPGRPEPVPAPPPPVPPAPVPPAEPTAPPPAEPPGVPGDTLSLEELGRRIEKTRAIGVFTKLALRNDVDDLLRSLRGHHERGEGRLDVLRQRYEALVLKLLALLEPEEPELAISLARSREAIWNRLADPARFAELST